MANDKQSLGLGFVRQFDLDVTIRELLAFGKFIGQCMDDARAEERKRCAEIVSRFNVDDCAWFDSVKQSMQEAMLEG